MTHPTRRTATSLLTLAIILHCLSYFMPVYIRGGTHKEVWGDIFWIQIPTDLYRAGTEGYEWIFCLFLYGTFLVLVHALYRWGRHHWAKKPLPSMFLLFVGLVLPNLFFVGIFVVLAFVSKATLLPLWGYYAWAFSFFLFWGGFFLYKKSNQALPNTLSDHLINP